MHSLCNCSLPIWRSSPSEKGPIIDLFLPHPGSTPGQGLRKSLTTSGGHEYFIPTKFRKHPSSSYEAKADCVPIHIYALIHAIVYLPPFLHLNKYIKNSLKIFKHLIFYISLLPLKTWKLHKINANKAIYHITIYRHCIKIRKNE